MNTSVRNSFTIVARSELMRTQMEEMYRLLADHFDGVAWSQFRRDLKEKNQVILIQRGGRLVGFSTLLVYETSFEGESATVVYSGDTIVAPEAWGSSALARGWITAVNQLREVYPRGRYYWLLITSGFRTYRFLPVFWREFFPRPNAVTPLHIQRLRDHLAIERFGTQYDVSSGVVRFHQPQRLQGALRTVPAERTLDPHVAFFLTQNPGHSEGDELVCLTELDVQNLTAAGRRMSTPVPCELLCDHR